ncbi:ATP-binding protein [filamentous cyanobacterium LEGE 11480]|uniref:ATP-binding protein n=1 Tax=Romeriopsis navalis LEGE 11480 TaxID=2777977 RepID=A0A928Z5I6_9CYAN|nr:ATP-binding protein [Romeriopsis navalis]MBE9031310.1 ATP-binding protein [Romeriopsis navalis LEGE 11480]
MDTRVLRQTVGSLLLYSNVLEQPPMQHWVQLLEHLSRLNQAMPPATSPADHPPTHTPIADVCQTGILQTYGQWFQALAAAPQGWQDYLFTALITTATPFSEQVQTKNWDDLPAAMQLAVRHDLHILQQIYQWNCEAIFQAVHQAVPDVPIVSWVDRLDPALLPTAQGHAASHLRSQLEHFNDWADAIPQLVDYYRQFGTGIFAQYQALRWSDGDLQGIEQPDPICLENLVGYDWQQQSLVQNTQALLAGYPALNVLLYGSRGSGKSSLIKALVNQFGDAGLRLIEVSKASLGDLPNIVEQLRSCPQKFIIFVDDLSFEEDDDAFKSLKVVLEGGVTARPDNVVVYATSNRRHLIREFYGDRPQPKDADEIHQWDTLQEKMSFSDRFGLTLTFEPAAQPTYLQIVQHLAQAARLVISDADLEFRALQWATQHNGRSGRSARQFIDYLTADLALNPDSELNADSGLNQVTQQ